MNKKNMLFALLGLFMFSVISQAADRAKQIKDLGIDGDNRLYDLVCPSGKGTILFHNIAHSDVVSENETDQEQDLVNLVEPSDDGPAVSSKPEVCTLKDDGEYDCKTYTDIDAAADAVCKKLG